MTDLKLTITAQPRETRGKKVKTLRREGLIPVNVFGLGEDSLALQLPQKPLASLLAEAGETNLIYLTVEGRPAQLPVLVDEIQQDVLTGSLFHVSFKQVSLKEKITATVPVEMIGELEPSDLVANLVLDEIEVEALPTDFPDKFEVDISELSKVGDFILVKDLKYDNSKVTLMLEDEQLEGPVVTIQAVAEEPEPSEEVEVEVGVVGEEDESEESSDDEESQEKSKE